MKPEKKKLSLKIVLTALLLVAAVAAGAVFFVSHQRSAAAYADAHSHLEAGRYSAAEKAFQELGSFRDSREMVLKTRYLHAVHLLEQGDYEDARDLFFRLEEYDNSREMVNECYYREALELLDAGSYQEALELFLQLEDYRDSETYSAQCTAALQQEAYLQAVSLKEQGDYAGAAELFAQAGSYEDAQVLAQECIYLQAADLMEQEDYTAAAALFGKISGYEDADAMAEECTLLSTPEGRTRRNFEGKWNWENPAVINPYDRYYDINFDNHTITFSFRSASKSFERVYGFEVISETRLVAEGFRDSGKVTILYENGKLQLEYSSYANAPSSNKAHLRLVRIGDDGKKLDPQQEITLTYSEEPAYYPGTEFLTFDSCIAGRSPINETYEKGVIYTYYHNEPYNADMSKYVRAYQEQYLQAWFPMETCQIKDYPSSTSGWSYYVYYDTLGNALYVSSGMSGSLSMSFAKVYLVPAEHMEQFTTDYLIQ